MSNPFAECSATVRALDRALGMLAGTADILQLPPLGELEWYQLLQQKLLPQLGDDAYLVVAVVGGTNIGKSVIFNQLAGFRASATSPLASGTKHPVCLGPVEFDAAHDLNAIFQGFEVRPWSDPQAPLEEHAEDLLYWRTSEHVPDNLLLLDTPDIDSDAQVNWRRADRVRRAADLLIAVLTQQKYNDAAVKQFFRKAAEEDKAIILVFNQVQLPEDDAYWPLWAGTFCRETGANPEFVYIVPSDRRAADELRLPFFEREWSEAGPNEAQATSTEPSPASAAAGTERRLVDDLANLRFDEIKFRALRGSLNQLLSDEQGVAAYLRDVEIQSRRFHAAVDQLSADRIARLEYWPAIPSSLLSAEIRAWWRTQRTGWSAKVHQFYNAVGTGVTWPFRAVRDQLRGERPVPFEDYRQAEWAAILQTVERAYERLTLLADSGNELLAERLRPLVEGRARGELLAKLQTAHAAVDLEQELAAVVSRQMATFRDESPQFYTFLRRLDQTAAVARPATSIVLFVVGFGPAGDAAAQLLAHSALQSVVHVAGDIAGGTMVAAVGDTALSSTATGLSYIEAKFRNLQAAFTASRLTWLLELLSAHLWGDLLDGLRAGADLPRSDEYRQVEESLRSLKKQMRQIPQVASKT